MKATKYNKRAGKRTRVIRIRRVQGTCMYLWKELGILHVISENGILAKAVKDISFDTIRNRIQEIAGEKVN